MDQTQMKLKKKNNKKSKREKVYECKHFEADCDDLGKYYWCHAEDSCNAQCGFKYKYAMQKCPYFKKGRLAGSWEISNEEMQEAEDFEKASKQKLHDQEVAERALYEHLKKKFG